MNREILETTLAPLQLALSDQQLDQFAAYGGLLQQWNQRINLTAVDDDEGIAVRHFYDSLLVAKAFPGDGRLADIGSGAGFPGIPLAILEPRRSVTLVEPTQKKCRFLQAVVEELDLANVAILPRRAEELKEYRESFDTVVARALAELNVLAELCLPLTSTGGRFIAMKGPKAARSWLTPRKRCAGWAAVRKRKRASLCPTAPSACCCRSARPVRRRGDTPAAGPRSRTVRYEPKGGRRHGQSEESEPRQDHPQSLPAPSGI